LNSNSPHVSHYHTHHTPLFCAGHLVLSHRPRPPPPGASYRTTGVGVPPDSNTEPPPQPVPHVAADRTAALYLTSVTPPLKGHHPHGRRSPFPTSPFSCSKRAHCLSSAALHRVQSRLTGALPLPSSPSFRPHWCPLRSTELRHRLGNHRASVFHRPHRRHGSWVSPHRCLFVRHAAPAPLVLTPPPLPQLVRWCARACRASATTLRMVTMRVSAPSALRRLGPPRCLGC
jgi:hypothetical protein